MSDLAATLLAWYAGAARDLPWRRPGVAPWAVLVSEVMLQQTPVARALPAYAAWLERWPTPESLAEATPADAVRQWGRLGYPRRALRLHAAAETIMHRFGGEVPRTVEGLLALPGVGSYTARAVAAFAFGQRHAVVDTNVRRVVARAIAGRAHAGPPAATRDLGAVEHLLPLDPALAARFSVALMELGALVCTARAPRCGDCPIASGCAWRSAGHPPYQGPARRSQRYAGTDRQVRGLILAALRDTAHPLADSELAPGWHDPDQRARALRSLVADGLVRALPDGGYALPT
jgi:A/G-specific adenine glycosylase